MKNESSTTLESVASMMKEYTTQEVEISGHTDSDGSEEYDQQLSESRAKNVVEFLMNHGISKVAVRSPMKPLKNYIKL